MNVLAWHPAFCQSGGAGNASYLRWQSQRRLQLRTTTSRHLRPPPLQVLDESKDIEKESVAINERSESDKMVDAMDFGDLCNDFECISSPSVEATARQLARDILELREGNRSLGSYSISVKYKTVQAMQMLSTSELSIKWQLKGRPKNPVFATFGGDLILQVNSRFTLNQISGQVIEHDEFWDLSASSVVGQTYFWISRRLFSAIEAGKDTIDAVKSMASGSSSEKENKEIFPDLSGDPTKFFQRDDGLQRDAYQIALLLAIIYFVVQFLRATL
ncbi:uncharacterized protein LOC110103993 isoform X2 [Dendrobium catenatum]|uniref:uncharacterized protein LOC110103993 isoform X2 n=1 Tax=Dendrobium catenatum TaxID=906689 RepID=UPI00109FC62B|nr:uncharacterized protein LOC110103993 isoform X2 [Dendrobium catenatum]